MLIAPIDIKDQFKIKGLSEKRLKALNNAVNVHSAPPLVSSCTATVTTEQLSSIDCQTYLKVNLYLNENELK